MQQRIALLILKQWKELNDHQNINNKKILYATAATSPSNNENTKINKDTPVRIRRRTFLANANQYNVADGSFESDASGGSDNKNGSNRKSSRRNTEYCPIANEGAKRQEPQLVRFTTTRFNECCFQDNWTERLTQL